ncbi:MAG: TonB-dependent receptor [Acidobacteria bacterium]|nr:MAG: TonB-dependent receptor [Acidobacteriota bacterium]
MEGSFLGCARTPSYIVMPKIAFSSSAKESFGGIMKGKLGRLLNLVLISVVGCTAAWAQATAQISGTVKDQSGAVLPGVEITATQTETGIARNAVSNESGTYILSNLGLGPYRLEVALPGFRTYVQTGIVLQVNSSPVVNAVLEIGQVAETVEVEANAAMVETRSVGIAQIIENERILELPLNGRNVTELITLTAGAVQSGLPAAMNFDTGRFISVNGGVGYGVSYNLDGAPHTDQYSGLGQPFPFPDALQEFKVETSGVTAQNGGQSGAYVNSVTKSGTNDLHGDLFEFVRNDLFNARNYFALTGSSLKRNQFGGTLGGPIMQNKLFFFGGYQGTTTRQDPANTRSFVPTKEMLAGDFTTFASGACNASGQVNLKAPFFDNRIDPTLFSKAALNIASKLPPAQDPCGQVTYGNILHRNDGQVVGRVDYQASTRHSLFGRYLATWYKVAVPYDLNQNLLSTADRGYNNASHALTLGSTYLAGPNMVNSFRLAGGLTYVTRVGASIFSAPDVGINAYSYLPHFIALTVGTAANGFSVGCGTCTYSTFNNYNVQINDDLSIQRSSHQIVFGGVVSRAYSNGMSNVLSSGTYNFNGQQTGLALADFLTGRLNTFSQSGPALMLTHRYYIGFYAQDTWNVTPRLTANYGLRWEPYFPQVLDDKRIYNWDYNRFKQGAKSAVFKGAPAGFDYPGDPGFPGNTGIHRDLKMFQPRVGLAWDVNGDGRMSVRASYGIAYTFLPLVLQIDTANSPPWGNSVQLTTPAGGFDNPWLGYPGGNPFPTEFNADTPFVKGGLYNNTPYDIKNTYAQSWNLGVQREVARNWLVSATYTGSTTLHLWTQQQLNSGVFMGFGACAINGVNYTTCSTPQNLAARRKLTLENPQEGPYFTLLSQFDSGGTMSYHGMLLNVERRAAKGITVSSNYTWSHCIGDLTDFNGSGPNPGQDDWQDDNNRRGDRANCVSDRRHVFNLTAVAESPQFANNRLRAAGSGWRLSLIHRRSSGRYLNITSGIDNSLTGKSNQRAQQVLANPYGDTSGRPGTNFLNPAAFKIPATGAFGNVDRNSVEGPGTWSFDTALSRVFRFRETQRLEVRAEAFNILNRFRSDTSTANAFSTAVNGSTFGVIRTALEPRIMQFALKYIF